MSGEVPAEGFLRMTNEAGAVVSARREEFLQDAIAYKDVMTARKNRLPPGTPWDPADGPDPDMIIIEDGEVSCFDPLFGDQHKRLERAIDDQKWRDRLRYYEARLVRLKRRLNEELDLDNRAQLEEDIEAATYFRDSARFALGMQAVQPPRPKTLHGNSHTSTGALAANDLPAANTGGDDGEDD
ncbi:MAG: hypothetical protein QM744_10845 [Mesorhizobium sp.]